MSRVALALLLLGCSATTTNGSEPPPPEEAVGFSKLSDLLPPAPTDFDKAVDVTARDRQSIFEQINGGSVSYLDNGMIDALFAVYPRTGGSDAEALDLEIYRFDGETGALAQFGSLHGKDGKAWKGGATAVIHDFGIELLAQRVLVRVTFNDGPKGPMGVAAQVVARQIVRRITGK